jgi:hypothetical protein
MTHFDSFAVIDWSGAKSLWHKGIAIAVCKRGNDAPLIISPPAPHWTRQAALDWILQQAKAGKDMIIGVDLSMSLPFIDHDAFFPGWDASPAAAKQLWRLVDEMSADDDHLSVTSFLRHPEASRHFRQHRDCGDLFQAGAGRMRVCEAQGQAAIAGVNPVSCFNLVGAAQVGKSSLTGMRVLHRMEGRIPVWPFDPLPARGPVIVEIYTSVAARASGVLPKGKSKILDGTTLDRALDAFGSAPHARLAEYTDHATDAILTAAWLRNVAHQTPLWSPEQLTPQIAATEGWTFGVS